MAARKKRWKKLLVAIAGLFGLIVLVGVASFIYDQYRYDDFGGSYSKGESVMMATSSRAPGLFAGNMDMDESFVSNKRLAREPAALGIADTTYADDGRVDAESALRHIIQTGDLSLIVESVQDALDSIKALTLELEGFVSESSIREQDDQSFSGWISIRIPSEKFDEALEMTKDLAVRVENENTRADDVTDQVVDMETRLLNLKTQEDQYREIMRKAYTVEDILQVTNQLNNVRQQIERLDAQLKSLEDRVSFSTLTINLLDEGDVEVFGIYWRPLFQVKQAFRDALENLTGSVDSIVVILFNIPVILLWIGSLVFLIWFGWRLGKWFWRKVSR